MKDLLIDWLKDAHAMEQSQKQMLERFVGDFDDFPEIKSRLEQHIEVTERQAEDIQSCLERLGEDASAAKSAMGKVGGVLQGMMTTPFEDDAVKNMIAMHAGEHLEHASYLSLAAAAREYGEEEIAATCERIMHEELEMAKFIEEQLPDATVATIQKDSQ